VSKSSKIRTKNAAADYPDEPQAARQTEGLRIRPALASDATDCVNLRGKTRENAVSVHRLAQLGITAQSWAADVAGDRLPGFVATDAAGALAGYCFGDRASGEVVVLALLPQYEGQGLGRELLARVVAALQSQGHQRLFLGCSSNPQHRSYGFYRHLGWRSTGRTDRLGDEELEWRFDG
jgi:GNAT superfamily N-acetyltransferase